MSTIKLGIALYAQVDTRGRPTSPHWALVAHQSSFAASDVIVFQVTRNPGGPVQWITKPKQCTLLGAPTLMGVVDLGVANMRASEFTAFADRFSASKDGDDPSGLFAWGCASYVIRVLHYLHNAGRYRLVAYTNQVYDRVGMRIQTLKNMPAPSQGNLNIIPF